MLSYYPPESRSPIYQLLRVPPPIEPPFPATTQKREFLSDTRLKAFRRCRRLHYLRYELGYKPLERAQVLRFGDLIHASQEAWWLWDLADKFDPDGKPAGINPERLEYALERMRAKAATLQTDAFDLVRAEEMMRGYHFRWIDAPLRTLAVEVEFTAPLVHPVTGEVHELWHLRGKLDVVVENTDTGEELIVEHKSSSENLEAGGSYWQKRRLDTQVSMYFAGAKALGYSPAGCLFDVLLKPKLEPLKATPVEARKFTKAGALYATQRDRDETLEEHRARLREAIAEAPEKYFQRGDVPRLERDLTEAMQDVWEESELLDHSRYTGLWPRNASTCFDFGRACDFWGPCSGSASIDDPSLFKRRSEAPNAA